MPQSEALRLASSGATIIHVPAEQQLQHHQQLQHQQQQQPHQQQQQQHHHLKVEADEEHHQARQAQVCTPKNILYNFKLVRFVGELLKSVGIA